MVFEVHTVKITKLILNFGSTSLLSTMLLNSHACSQFFSEQEHISEKIRNVKCGHTIALVEKIQEEVVEILYIKGK